MKAIFLEASVPLTKTFTKEGGELRKIGHPQILNYTSHEEEFTTIEELTKLIDTHARLGHCFLKGQLSRQLTNEPRAGTTNSNTGTQILMLDLDGLKDVEKPNELLGQLKLKDVDHIIQYSCSMGVMPERGLSAHLFILLDREYTPAQLKQWLINANLTIPALRSNLRLTRTNNTLHWPLDITTCQNDKLIYIAPPILGKGVEDTFSGERIILVKRKHRSASLTDKITAVEVNKSATEDALNALRATAGLPKRSKTVMRTQGTVEYMIKPDTAIVTGLRNERGFVYLNINGGDSWGYYHPDNNPEFIYNFKNEPTYKTSELLPDYWREVKGAINEARADGEGNLFLAFRDFNTALYYNGTYNVGAKTLSLAVAKNESQLKHFLKQHGQPIGDFIPDWTVGFNPQSTEIVNTENKVVNVYQPSKYMKITPIPTKKIPPTIRRIIFHMCGEDEEVFEHFMNWCAVIVQYRCKTGTCWVFHGTEGTGKGVMVNHILAPILGGEYVIVKRMEELESQFNGYMEKSLILAIDEAQLSEFTRGSIINASLKNYIVEPMVSIRRMHTLPYMAPSYMNIMFLSNMPDPCIISPEDRRFNVGVYQPKRLEIKNFENIEKELEGFYHYLATRPADKEQARTTLNNGAKALMSHISRASIDVATEALLTGNLEFFEDLLPTQGVEHLPSFDRAKADAYVALVREMKKFDCLTREEIYTLFNYAIGGMPSTPYKLSSLLKHHKIYIGPVRRGKDQHRGIPVTWQQSK